MDRPNGFDEGLKIALERLRFGDKFEAEVRRDLLSRGVTEEVAQAVIFHLRSRKLVSDRRTLEAHLRKRSGRKAIGRDRLRIELLARGAPEELVDDSLGAGKDEAALARAVLDGRFGPSIDPGRGARFLAGRGFDADTIRAVIEIDE